MQRIINKDGVEVYLIQELSNGKVEVGFNSCNKTKICSKYQFTSGTVSDYISVPSQYDFVQYHLGEQRLQKNGNIAQIIGGNATFLLAEDTVTHYRKETKYKYFYEGTCFNEQDPKTVVELQDKYVTVKNTFEMKLSFSFNGIDVYKYGNRSRGYIPCIRLGDNLYKTYNCKRDMFYNLTLEEMGKWLRKLGWDAECYFDCNFFVGTKLNILPFNISATIISTCYTGYSVQAIVELDETHDKTVVDLMKPYLSLQGLVTGNLQIGVSTGEEYSRSKAGVLFYYDNNKLPLLIRNLRVINGAYFADVSYKVARAENRVRTKSMRLKEIDLFIHDERRRMKK